MVDVVAGAHGEFAAEIEVPKERSILKEVAVTVLTAGLVIGTLYAALQVQCHPCDGCCQAPGMSPCLLLLDALRLV